MLDKLIQANHDKLGKKLMNACSKMTAPAAMTRFRVDEEPPCKTSFGDAIVVCDEMADALPLVWGICLSNDKAIFDFNAFPLPATGCFLTALSGTTVALSVSLANWKANGLSGLAAVNETLKSSDFRKEWQQDKDRWCFSTVMSANDCMWIPFGHVPILAGIGNPDVDDNTKGSAFATVLAVNPFDTVSPKKSSPAIRAEVKGFTEAGLAGVGDSKIYADIIKAFPAWVAHW